MNQTRQQYQAACREYRVNRRMAQMKASVDSLNRHIAQLTSKYPRKVWQAAYMSIKR